MACISVHVFLCRIYSMNALWITRMSTYKSSGYSILSARAIIEMKILHQCVLLKRYKRIIPVTTITTKNSINDILLEEARTAKHFWKEFTLLLPSWVKFKSRKPRGVDGANRLLDIGYHHICGIVKKILDTHDISTALGLLHVARTSKSDPLVYDLVELFRSDIVDAEVLRFLRLKKHPIIADKEISHFLHEINQRLDRKFYIKQFGVCQTYRYYMELQILSFIHAVNHKKIFVPLRLPARHEQRCKMI